MLISFSVENWQSFRERAELSMVATREKQHLERVARIDKYKIKLLPIAAIYGGNASGKTKFFNALNFARSFIVSVTQPESSIPRESFKLDKACADKPSNFSFGLFINDSCYEFLFSVTSKKVVEEKLTKILPSSSRKILYHRQKDKIEFLDSELKNNEYLQYTAKSTRDNQLFLTTAIDQKIEIQYFKDIYSWFKNNLFLIGGSDFFTFTHNAFKNSALIGELASISFFDTGISGVKEVDFSLEHIPIDSKTKKFINDQLREGETIPIGLRGEKLLLSKKNEEIIAKKIITYHKSVDGEDIPFDYKDESHGTLRLMDLFPYFFELWGQKTNKTFFFDELDGSLHPVLTRRLINLYLDYCNFETRTQLIFTAHDVQLIDQSLFRRDEIWATERDHLGCSQLFSFGDFKEMRTDKDIRKSYLEGRLGGIPKKLRHSI